MFRCGRQDRAAMPTLFVKSLTPDVAGPAAGMLRGRILFLVNDAAFFVSHRLPLARAAKAAGMEVHVATPPDAASAGIAAEGFMFHSITMSRSGANPWNELRTFFSIVRLLANSGSECSGLRSPDSR